MRSVPPPTLATNTPAIGVPFSTTEEAWFWFIQARAAQLDGAARTGRPGSEPRPCEPADILNILNRLYRDRLITIEHLRVLKYYGDRHTAPDQNRKSEYAASALWAQAMERLTERFVRHGIVTPPPAWWSENEPDNRRSDKKSSTRVRTTPRRHPRRAARKTLSTGGGKHAA